MRRCKAEVPPSHVWLVEGVPKKNQSYWTCKPIYKPLLLKLKAQIIVNDSFIIRFDFWLNISYHTMLIFAMMLLVITSKSTYIIIYTLYLCPSCVPIISWHHLQCVCPSMLFLEPWSRRKTRKTRLFVVWWICRRRAVATLPAALSSTRRSDGRRWCGMVRDGEKRPRTSRDDLGMFLLRSFYMI